MNIQLPPHLENLRKLILITGLATGPFLAFQTGHAQPPADVATATLTSGGMNSVTIGPSGAFTLTLGITTNFPAGGYTVFYQSNNGSGLFPDHGARYSQPVLHDRPGSGSRSNLPHAA